jgi:hypothetical protein
MELPSRNHNTHPSVTSMLLLISGDIYELPHCTREATAPTGVATEVAADVTVVILIVVGTVIVVLRMVHFRDKVVLHVAVIVGVAAVT